MIDAHAVVAVAANFVVDAKVAAVAVVFERAVVSMVTKCHGRTELD